MIDLPHKDSLPKETIEKLKAENARAKKVITEEEAKVQKYAKNLQDLKIAFDFLTWQKEQKEAERFVEHTNRTFILKFWIQAEHVKLIETELSKITDNYVLSELEINEEENAPVPLKNKSFV